MSNIIQKAELTKHIPDLWKYSLRLCASEAAAGNLLRDTLDAAIRKQWQKPESTPLYTWLGRLMYRIFVTDYYTYTRRQGRASPGTFRYQFQAPVRDGDLAAMSALEGTVSVH